jgi:F0F1-type ATP synthase assembly protein I
MIKLPQPNGRQRAIAGQSGTAGAGLDNGISIASYPIGGVVAYGLLGWLVATLIHASWPIPVGMVLGLAIGTAYVIYRYGTETGRIRAEKALASKNNSKNNNPPKGD